MFRRRGDTEEEEVRWRVGEGERGEISQLIFRSQDRISHPIILVSCERPQLSSLSTLVIRRLDIQPSRKNTNSDVINDMTHTHTRTHTNTQTY